MERLPLLKHLAFAATGDLGDGPKSLDECIIERLIERHHTFLDQHQPSAGAGEKR
jgi:hypothetical protein